ncbi:MAG: hypothetical protein HW412_1713 [Bacteroidetes bacterium]|nr:hypothetical protein [Bacteroidota bacterium]
MKLQSKILRLSSLFLGLVTIAFFARDGHLEAQNATLYLQNINYSVQVGMYERFRSTHADVVMLGNSLSYNANWNELLGRNNIANRGIVGDLTDGYLHRLSYVYKLSPRLCFIEGGVNDIYENRPPKEIIRNYRQIVDTLRAHHIMPIIQSTLFVGAKWRHAREKNTEIQELNELLAGFAKEQSIQFLDINALVSTDGLLRGELTYDGVHLNARGYSYWVPEVEKVLVKNGL